MRLIAAPLLILLFALYGCDDVNPDSVNTTESAKPFRIVAHSDMQTSEVIEERHPGDSLYEYMQAIEVAANEALANEPAHPAGGYLVFAVRPSGQSMVWLQFEPAIPTAVASKLKTAVLKVPACKSRNGVFVFSLSSSLWGAPESNDLVEPVEWREEKQVRDYRLDIGTLVDKVWPAENQRLDNKIK
ncbi:MAG: hypothetical protein ACRCTL_18185 [Pseudomonas sp.]